MFLWIIYYKQLHDIPSLRNKYAMLFIPSGINIVDYFQGLGLGLRCLTPLSTTFQLYHIC
jgi:putative effector of murein hydrolase LrgA (UPF0299 family)